MTITCETHMWCSHVIMWLVCCHGALHFFFETPHVMSTCEVRNMISCVNLTDVHTWRFCTWCSHVMFTCVAACDVHMWSSHVKFGTWFHMWTCLKIICGFPMRCNYTFVMNKTIPSMKFCTSRCSLLEISTSEQVSLHDERSWRGTIPVGQDPARRRCFSVRPEAVIDT